MAYDIGERVTNRFMGNGRVVSDAFKIGADSEGKGGTLMQRVQFDNPTLGERDWEVRKLSPAEDGGDIGA